MVWEAVGVLLVLTGAFLGTGRRMRCGGKDMISLEKVFRSGRDRLRILLERVEREEPPEFVMGAMCYRPAAVPDRVEYICPVCAGRTLYSGNTAYMLHQEIDAVRRLMGELAETPFFTASLDEGQLCSWCSEDRPDEPELFLSLVYEEGDTVVTSVTLQDIQVLSGLVSGELSYSDSYDAKHPLNAQLLRLRRLLDIQRN